MVRDAHVVVEQFSLLNNNSPKAPCGTRSASVAENVIVPWIRCVLAMDRIRRFIAARATVACSDQRASVMDTPQLCVPAVNLRWTSTFRTFWFLKIILNFCKCCSARVIGGARPTDGSGCPRCGFVVFEAEKMISKNSCWHKRCFNCADCHRSLDSTNLCDAPNGEIYWWARWSTVFYVNFIVSSNSSRGCYGRTFGPRGIGFGLGAGCLSMV